MPEIHHCFLVDCETSEILADGWMTFAEADVVVATWFADRTVQVLIPEDWLGPYDR